MQECQIAVKKRSVTTFLFGVNQTLSIEEAAAYSGIGMGKLYEMTESQDCPFVLWIGSRRMIKRKVFDEFIERQYSI